MQCRAKYTKAQIDACHAYATEAVKQAEANQAKKCNSEGPRFSEDRELHFSWCVGQIETDGVKMTLVTKQEHDAREAINNNCKRVVRLGKKRDKNMLQPIPSPGGSPFGAADKSGQSAMDRLGGPAAPATGGYNTSKGNMRAPAATPPAKWDGTRSSIPASSERALPKSKLGF